MLPKKEEEKVTAGASMPLVSSSVVMIIVSFFTYFSTAGMQKYMRKMRKSPSWRITLGDGGGTLGIIHISAYC